VNQKILLVNANPFDGDISPVEPFGLEIIKDSLSALPVEVKIIDPFMAIIRPYSYAIDKNFLLVLATLSLL